MADVQDAGFLRDSASGAVVVVSWAGALAPITVHNGLPFDATGALVVKPAGVSYG